MQPLQHILAVKCLAVLASNLIHPRFPSRPRSTYSPSIAWRCWQVTSSTPASRPAPAAHICRQLPGGAGKCPRVQAVCVDAGGACGGWVCECQVWRERKGLYYSAARADLMQAEHNWHA